MSGFDAVFLFFLEVIRKMYYLLIKTPVLTFSTSPYIPLCSDCGDDE